MLGSNRMNRRADQPAAVFSHPEDIFRGNSIGADRKIRLALAVIEIVEEDELALPQRRERLVGDDQRSAESALAQVHACHLAGAGAEVNRGRE